MRTLEHRSNNAYDTILLVESGQAIGAWTVGERGDEMDNFRDPGDLSDWDPTSPEVTDPEAYGELVAQVANNRPNPVSNTKSYHISNLGSFAGDVKADIDGYVHLTTEAVMGGNWDTAGEEMDEEWAAEIAVENRSATEKSEKALSEWQEQN